MPTKPPPTVGRATVNANLMIVLRPKDNSIERYVLLIESPQARARNEPYLEFPKGVFDASGNFGGPMMDNLRQEHRLNLTKEPLINLTALVQKMQPLTCEPGSYDERAVRSIRANPNTTVLLWERYLDRKEIESLRGSSGGRRAPGGAINIRMLEYRDFTEIMTRKVELRHGWEIYELLHSHHILQQLLHEKSIGN